MGIIGYLSDGPHKHANVPLCTAQMCGDWGLLEPYAMVPEDALQCRSALPKCGVHGDHCISVRRSQKMRLDTTLPRITMGRMGITGSPSDSPHLWAQV